MFLTEFSGSAFSSSLLGIALFLLFVSPLQAQQFGSQETILPDAGAKRLTVGDVDGDELDDVIAVLASDGSVVWFQNLGDGGFSDPQTIVSGSSMGGVERMRLGDLDGDGLNDVVLASNSEVSWFENPGEDGSWNQSSITNSINDIRGIRTKDMNGDDEVDVLSASAEDDKVAWYKNEGGGEFGSQRIISQPWWAQDVHPADLDGDGDPDVISVSEFETPEVQWNENRLDETEDFGSSQPVSGDQADPGTALSADVDSDGDQDIITRSSRSGKLNAAWHENRLDSGEGFSTNAILQSSDEVGQVYTRDIDLDGEEDLFMGVSSATGIAWYPNAEEGGFGSRQTIDETSSGEFRIAPGDLNGDGSPDIVAITTDDQKIVWYENQEGGTGEGPNLTVNISAVDDFTPGTNLNVTVELTNEGEATSNSVYLDVTLPENPFPSNFDPSSVQATGFEEEGNEGEVPGVFAPGECITAKRDFDGGNSDQTDCPGERTTATQYLFSGFSEGIAAGETKSISFTINTSDVQVTSGDFEFPIHVLARATRLPDQGDPTRTPAIGSTSDFQTDQQGYPVKTHTMVPSSSSGTKFDMARSLFIAPTYTHFDHSSDMPGEVYLTWAELSSQLVQQGVTDVFANVGDFNANGFLGLDKDTSGAPGHGTLNDDELITSAQFEGTSNDFQNALRSGEDSFEGNILAWVNARSHLDPDASFQVDFSADSSDFEPVKEEIVSQCEHLVNELGYDGIILDAEPLNAEENAGNVLETNLHPKFRANLLRLASAIKRGIGENIFVFHAAPAYETSSMQDNDRLLGLDAYKNLMNGKKVDGSTVFNYLGPGYISLNTYDYGSGQKWGTGSENEYAQHIRETIDELTGTYLPPNLQKRFILGMSGSSKITSTHTIHETVSAARVGLRESQSVSPFLAGYFLYQVFRGAHLDFGEWNAFSNPVEDAKSLKPKNPVSASETETVSTDGNVDFGDTGVDISFSGTSGSGKVTVDRLSNAPSNVEGISESNVSSYRHVVESGGNLSFGSNTEIRLDVGSLGGISDPSEVTIYKRSNPGEGEFTALETNYDSEAGELVATTGSFSEFALASNTNPLPVELSSFSATAKGEKIRLTWRTASEENNAGFEVQHQPQGSEAWSTLGFVESKAPGGTTTETNAYQYTAEDLTVGTHRFRLKQQDLDGSTTLTDPVTVKLRMQEVLKLTPPSPNPVSEAATVSFAVKEEMKTTVALYNTLGQRVKTLYDGVPTAGENRRIQLHTDGLSSGTYFIRLQVGDKTRTQRLTVVR